MTPRQRAQARLAQAQETAVQAHQLAQRYPNNGFYATSAARAAKDLEIEIKSAQALVRRSSPLETDLDDARWVAMWSEIGRRQTRAIKELVRRGGFKE